MLNQQYVRVLTALQPYSKPRVMSQATISLKKAPCHTLSSTCYVCCTYLEDSHDTKRMRFSILSDGLGNLESRPKG